MPSPWSLRRKILIKAKRLTLGNVNDVDPDDDEDEDNIQDIKMDDKEKVSLLFLIDNFEETL